MMADVRSPEGRPRPRARKKPVWRQIHSSLTDHKGKPITGSMLTCCSCGQCFDVEPAGPAHAVVCDCGRVHQLNEIKTYEYIVMEQKRV
jgi:hypothetical protein